MAQEADTWSPFSGGHGASTSRFEKVLAPISPPQYQGNHGYEYRKPLTINQGEPPTMTRSQALLTLPLIAGFAAGLDVEFYDEDQKLWVVDPNPDFNPSGEWRVSGSLDESAGG